MRFKPAGIKTVREAIKRLMNGEVFYSPEDWKIIYDDANVRCSASDYNPFKVVRSDGRSEPINLLWKRISNWQIEYEWEDDIGDGVLCWVSDFNRIPDKHDYVRLITAYDKDSDYPYRSISVGYRFARPLTLEEAKKHVKG